MPNDDVRVDGSSVGSEESDVSKAVELIDQGRELPQELLQELERLSEKEGAVGVVRRVTQTMHYSGLLPPPHLFSQYDKKTREVMLRLVEKQQDHAHDMQRTGLVGAIEKDTRGQRYGLTVALVGLLLAIVIAFFDPKYAAIFGTIDLLGMVAVFVVPRIFHRKPENEIRDEE